MSVARRCLSLIVTACVLMPGAMPGAARGQQAGESLLAIVIRGADCGGLPASIAVSGRPPQPASENGIYYLRGAAGQEYTLTATHRGYDSEQRTLRLEERQSREYINLRRSTDGARCDDLLGRVDGIKELVRGGRDERQHRTPTPRVQRRPGVGSRVDMAPDSSLFLDDSLWVDRQFHARVRIDRQAGRSQSGTLVFFAEPKDAALDTVIQHDRSDQPGSFALKRDGDQVAIAIRSGALGVAEWNPGGFLTVYAGRQRAVIKGTSALFLSSGDGEEAIMFLDEGDIEFPDYPSVTIPDQAVVRLNRHGPQPLPPGASAALVGALSAELTFAVKDLWAVSLFEKPWIYLGAALVGVTTWCIIDPDCPNGRDTEVDLTFIVPNFPSIGPNPSRF